MNENETDEKNGLVDLHAAIWQAFWAIVFSLCRAIRHFAGEFLFTHKNWNPFAWIVRLLHRKSNAWNKFPVGSITTIHNRFGYIPKTSALFRSAIVRIHGTKTVVGGRGLRRLWWQIEIGLAAPPFGAHKCIILYLTSICFDYSVNSTLHLPFRQTMSIHTHTHTQWQPPLICRALLSNSCSISKSTFIWIIPVDFSLHKSEFGTISHSDAVWIFSDLGHITRGYARCSCSICVFTT